MNPFEFNSNSFLDGLTEIEDGIYFKHYEWDQKFDGIDGLPDKEGLMYGNPDRDMILWERQLENWTDTIAYRTAFEKAFGSKELSQAKVKEELIYLGLYQSECGMSFDGFLKSFNINMIPESTGDFVVERLVNSSVTELIEYVDSDAFVLCYVNSFILDYPSCADIPGLNADAFVHVIGIKFEEEEDYIFINDSSCDNGAGKKILLKDFMNAWSVNGYTAVGISRR